MTASATDAHSHPKLDAFTGGATPFTEGERATLAEVRARLLTLSGLAHADDNAEAAQLSMRQERRM